MAISQSTFWEVVRVTQTQIRPPHQCFARFFLAGWNKREGVEKEDTSEYTGKIIIDRDTELP